MSHISNRIIKALLLSATIALANNAKTSAKSLSQDLDLNSNPNPNNNLSKDNRKIIKDIYKIKRDGTSKLIAGHRSHSSHSSHRSSSGGHYSSHYSHSSSSSSYYGSSSSSESSSSSSNNNTKSGSSNSTIKKTLSSNSKPSISPEAYSLGDRALKIGLYGADVNRLVSYLVKYNYIKDNGLSKKGEYYIYDSKIVSAVKHFQKDAKFTPDGKLSTTQADMLASWSTDKTTISLGFRDLYPPMSGYDVDELVRLLIKAGYSPDPAKLKTNGGHYIYSNDIMTALKFFQTFNKIKPTGNLDSTTISKLKAYDK